MRYGDARLSVLEQKLDDLAERVARLEGQSEGHSSLPPLAAPPAVPLPPSPAPPRPARRRRRDLDLDFEDLLGGRVLAWVGGSAVLLGIVLFLGMAISRGWIDEPTRTVFAFLGSSTLLGLGVWLYERNGGADAALAAVGVGISGLYATLIVATQVYELIPAEVGLGCAGLVGGVGTAIAVRWRSPIVGAIGILGALLGPVLVDAGTSRVSLAFMALALGSAVGILLWRRWNWLALGAFAVSAPQLIGWIVDKYEDELTLTLGVLLAFGGLYVVAAIGYELRVGSQDRLPVSSWMLLLLNVVLVAGMGYGALSQTDHPSGAIAWIVLLALAHILLGAFALRQAINREIGSLLVAVGLALSAIAFADALGGPVLVAGWAAQAVILAYLAPRAPSAAARFGSDANRLLLGSGIYLGLAIGHILAFEAPVTALREGTDDLAKAVVALAAVALAAFGSAWILRHTAVRWPNVLEAVGASVLVYLGSVAIVDGIGVHADGTPRQAGQVWLSAYWTVLGLAAVVVGLFRDDRRLRLGGLGLLGLAVVKVFVYDLSELEQIYRVLSFIALGLLLLVGAFAYGRMRVAGGAGDRT